MHKIEMCLTLMLIKFRKKKIENLFIWSRLDVEVFKDFGACEFVYILGPAVLLSEPWVNRGADQSWLTLFSGSPKIY